MISPEVEAAIRRLFFSEHWKVETIAQHFGVHHSAVRRAVGLEGPRAPYPARPLMIEAYLPFIRESWARHPHLTAARLFWMCRDRGYPGRIDHFREQVRALRPHKRAPEAFLRRRTLPGEESQVDWAHFGKVEVGRAQRPLMAFVMVLSWSRHLFLHFFLDARLGSFLSGHRQAFEAWNAVPRRVLTDNLKSVVLQRVGSAIDIHPIYRDFADHYRFEVVPVAPYRGNEKGRVERAIRWIRSAFFAARTWRDLDDLNDQARRWCEEQARERRWPDDREKTVAEAFAKEHGYLLELPAAPFATEDRQEARIGKTPYVRYDTNDYSVPPSLVRETVTVWADAKTVRIVHQGKEVARHARHFDRGRTIEDHEHIRRLRESKRKASRHQGTHRLVQAIPSTQRLLDELHDQQQPLGPSIARLLALLERHGSRRLERAVAEALARGTPHVAAVQQVLECEIEKDDPAPLPVALPDDPRVKNLIVRPHSLDTYDTLAATADESEAAATEEDHDEDDEAPGVLAPPSA